MAALALTQTVRAQDVTSAVSALQAKPASSQQRAALVPQREAETACCESRLAAVADPRWRAPLDGGAVPELSLGEAPGACLALVAPELWPHTVVHDARILRKASSRGGPPLRLLPRLRELLVWSYRVNPLMTLRLEARLGGSGLRFGLAAGY